MQNLEDVEELQPTEDQIKYFRELSGRENYFNIVIESIAPEIKHEYLAKMCVMISMIGSPAVDRMISMIHTLLVGDPGTGKSKILEYILLLIKKSAIAVGGTMTGSGVTVTMDTLPNRQKMPRAGIVPLCNGGVAVIDEANQIPEEDFGKLYQAMGSGWINYNKGGFDITLQAMTTIVAGANPKYYSYKTEHTVVDNINMPGPLLSRFDLICNMQRIKKSSIERQQIINHIDHVDKVGVKKYIEEAGLMTPEVLASYITYAKTFNPVFTDEANDLTKDFQLKMEEMEQNEGSLPIDNRFYYSIKKISKSIARMYFSNKVKPEHVKQAIDVMKKCLLTFDMNVESGQLQMKMTSDAKNWQQSFIATCQYLEQKNPDGRFSEDECINHLVIQYPEYFRTIHAAGDRFTMMVSKMDKIGGRFKLA
jgi:replicative DNA helicase Mcm